MISSVVMGQSKESETWVETYGLIIGKRAQLKKKAKVRVTFGEGQKGNGIKGADSSENEVPEKYDSMIDALNHLSKEGWTLADSYATTIDGRYEYHWIIKKRIPLSQVKSFD